MSGSIIGKQTLLFNGEEITLSTRSRRDDDAFLLLECKIDPSKYDYIYNWKQLPNARGHGGILLFKKNSDKYRILSFGSGVLITGDSEGYFDVKTN
jgi:hypothetical protein